MTDSIEIDPPAPFVTFYSFKGGVGRSMALINVAGIVAGRGFRVLVIDLDLEAPGLSFLARHEQFKNSTEISGFVDLMHQAVEAGPDGDLFRFSPEDLVEKYSRNYPVPPEIRKSEEGSLRIMPAGKFDDAYQSRLNRLNLPELYIQGRGRPLIELFKTRLQEAKKFDLVLVDSRTGFSDESGICTRDLADQVVLISGLNHQNLQGSAAFLRTLREEIKEDRPAPLVVFSPIPNGEDDLVDEREKVAHKMFSEAWGRRLKFDLHIPYHPRLALTEEPHIFRRSRGYLYEAYIALGKSVERSIGFSAKAFAREATKALENNQFKQALAYLRKAAKLEGQTEIGEFTFSLRSRLDEDGFVEKAAPLLKSLPALLSPSAFETRILAHRLHEIVCESAAYFYERILEDGTEDADILGNYANFLTDFRGDYSTAETLHKRAIEVNPKHANNLGNYARLLFLNNRKNEALDQISQALANMNTNSLDLLSEVLFYLAAHAANEYPKSLSFLKSALQDGARSPDWKLDQNVEQARKEVYPEPDFLRAIAAVISDGANLDTLNAFDTWQNTKVIPYARIFEQRENVEDPLELLA